MSDSSFDIDIQAVLEKELYTTPPLMPVIVARLNGTKQDIPRALRVIKQYESNASLKHLRKIRNDPSDPEIMECIISQYEAHPSNQETILEKFDTELKAHNLFSDFRIARVPDRAPQTDHQQRACATIWPCKFARSNYLIQCMEGSLLNGPEKLVLKTLVNQLVDTFKNGDSSNMTATSAAVIFRCAKIYGVGITGEDTLASHPVKHSTILAVDSVARNAGAGYWKDDLTRPQATSERALCEFLQNTLNSMTDLDDHRIDAKFLPYLCTNYDILVTEEPCFMCTMGLIHSRIRRLFYIDTESRKYLKDFKPLCYPDKAIEDFLVHRDRQLNHRFEAWKITLIPPRNNDD